MNPLNCASLKASQRLADAGIVMETEVIWRKARDNHYYLLRAYDKRKHDIPAPSMAEVWRELPEHTQIKKYLRRTEVYIGDIFYENRNPTDALIDLLIWVKGKKEEI